MIIDGTDIRTLGMFILRGGSNDFLSFPERREPDSNNWAEHNGLDVDFSDLRFNAKKVSVQIYISAPDETTFNQRLSTFEMLHNAPGYRQIFVKEFNRTFSLRYLGVSDYSHRGGLVKSGQKSGKLTAEYAMDDPLQLFSFPQVPTGSGVSFVWLDSIDLAKFGVTVKEVYSTTLRPALTKPVLERTVKNISGTSADAAVAPKFQAKEITIDCIMKAATQAEFYRNYNALFGAVNKATPIELSTQLHDYICYYKAMNGFTKLSNFSNKIRVSFQLILQTV